MKGYEFGFHLEKNVSAKERIVSALSGAALLVNGLTGRISVRQAVSGGFLLFRGISGHCHLYNLFMKKKELTDDGKILVQTSIVVNKPKSEVYNFWRKLENLPLFMTHLESVNVIDKKHSEWRMKLLKGFSTIDWTAEIIQDKKNTVIAWESLPGSEIENTGEVEFEEIDSNSTQVTARIGYKAPAGKAGEVAAHLLNPILKLLIRQDIQNLKVFMESGEIPKSKLKKNGNHKVLYA